MLWDWKLVERFIFVYLQPSVNKNSQNFVTLTLQFDDVTEKPIYRNIDGSINRSTERLEELLDLLCIAEKYMLKLLFCSHLHSHGAWLISYCLHFRVAQSLILHMYIVQINNFKNFDIKKFQCRFCHERIHAKLYMYDNCIL